jgi:hypothetical protein
MNLRQVPSGPGAMHGGPRGGPAGGHPGAVGRPSAGRPPALLHPCPHPPGRPVRGRAPSAGLWGHHRGLSGPSSGELSRVAESRVYHTDGQQAGCTIASLPYYQVRYPNHFPSTYQVRYPNHFPSTYQVRYPNHFPSMQSGTVPKSLPFHISGTVPESLPFHTIRNGTQITSFPPYQVRYPNHLSLPFHIIRYGTPKLHFKFLLSVLLRIRIRRIHMCLGIPDPLVRDTDPYLDPFIIKQK